MQRHELLQQAAIVGRWLRIDPIIILEERDLNRRAARIAAARFISSEEEKANRRG